MSNIAKFLEERCEIGIRTNVNSTAQHFSHILGYNKYFLSDQNNKIYKNIENRFLQNFINFLYIKTFISDGNFKMKN